MIVLAGSKTSQFLLCENVKKKKNSYLLTLTLLHSKQPKLYGVLAVLSATGLKILDMKLGTRHYFSLALSPALFQE